MLLERVGFLLVRPPPLLLPPSMVILHSMKRLFLFGLFCTLSTHGQVENGSRLGTVQGSVVCNDGNVPGRGASVRLVPLSELIPSSKDHGTTPKEVETAADFDGRFVITYVPKGTYIVEAKKDGYNDDLELVRLVLGKLKPEQQNEILSSFPQVSVDAGTESERNLVLHRAGSLSGRVLADDGGTLAPTYVTAVLVSSPLVGNLAETPTFSRRGLTDDRGVYRIAGLPAGKYLVSVRLSEAYIDVAPMGKNNVSMRANRVGTAELQVFPPQAFKQADAKQVFVRDGDAIGDADITLPMNKLHSIGGKLLGPGQKPLPGAFVILRQEGQNALGYEAITDASGAYRFDLLPPGTYSLEVKGPGRSDQKERTQLGQTTVVLDNRNVADADISVP